MRSTSHPHHRRAALALTCLLGLVACGSDSPGTNSATSGPGTGGGNTTPATVETTPDGSTVPYSPPDTLPGGDFPPVDQPQRSGVLASMSIRATEVATLESPMVLIPRSGTDTLYVAERAGMVRTLTIGEDGSGTVGDDPVLDITDDTSLDGEQGLLGLAFSLDGSQLFVSHTNAEGNTRLAAYDMDGDVAVASSRTELLALEQPFSNHNGGNVVMGPDRMLWLGMGDGGSGDDPDNRAQDPEDRLGKMLRIDPTGESEPEIWASGLRNPWRFSFDTASGDLWIGDVGQGEWEEIDWLPADAEGVVAPGTNFGWSGYEGSRVFIDDRAPDQSVPPVFEMGHGDGWCSVTGGVVYRGSAMPELAGTYLFGDFCKPELHGLRLENGVVTDEQSLGIEVPGLVSINTDADGEVYLLSLEGPIFRLEAG